MTISVARGSAARGSAATTPSVVSVGPVSPLVAIENFPKPASHSRLAATCSYAVPIRSGQLRHIGRDPPRFVTYPPKKSRVAVAVAHDGGAAQPTSAF